MLEKDKVSKLNSNKERCGYNYQGYGLSKSCGCVTCYYYFNGVELFNAVDKIAESRGRKLFD